MEELYRKYYETIAPFAALKQGDTIGVLHTNMGDIKVKLFADKTPKTVENFVGLAKKGSYNDSKFHRVINEFMIQGGATADGESIFGGAFEDEFTNDLFNFRGALSMANTGRPVSNTTQFFIVQNTDARRWVKPMQDAGFPAEAIEVYEKLGGTPFLDHKHTVFGYVIEGMEVVDEIAAVETDGADAPVSPVEIVSVEIETYEG